MTEEEALEKIEEIKNKYDDYKYEEDFEAPSSALKSILEIAIQQPELNVISRALLTCRVLGKMKSRRLARHRNDDFRTSSYILKNLIEKRPELKEEALLLNDIIFNKISMEFTDCTPEQLYVVCKSLRYIVENDSKLADKALNLTKKFITNR